SRCRRPGSRRRCRRRLSGRSWGRVRGAGRRKAGVAWRYYACDRWVWFKRASAAPAPDGHEAAVTPARGSAVALHRGRAVGGLLLLLRGPLLGSLLARLLFGHVVTDCAADGGAGQ